MKTRKTFVLIVGGGPTGVTAGLYLQKFKIPHILIEKEKILKRIPRAHYYNSQTMEAWRNLGHLDTCFYNETENIHMWKSFSYCLNLNIDKILGTYNNFYSKYLFKDTYYEDISPSKVTHLSQYKVLAILYNYYIRTVKNNPQYTRPLISNLKLKFSSYRIITHLLKNRKEMKEATQMKQKENEENTENLETDVFLRFCGYDPSELLIGYEYDRFLEWEDLNKTPAKNSNNSFLKNDEENPSVVITQVKNAFTGEKEIIISNYVFVADGGRSSIKRDLNINDEKKRWYMKFVNIHFHSKHLSYLIKKNPSMLYFIFNEYIGVLVIHDFKEGEGVLHLPYVSDRELDLYDNRTYCLNVLEKIIGSALNDIQIHDIYKWTMKSSIASTFVENKSNRIILLGDAAHKLPPSGGFGLNLGICEVLNIVWKIGRIFHLKRNKYINSVQELPKLFNSKETREEKNHYANNRKTSLDAVDTINAMDTLNHPFHTLLSNTEKKQIQNLIESYNIERKLVTEYTVDCAVKNYEKGSKIPSILGYEYKYMQLLQKWKVDSFIKKSSVFYYFMKNAKKLLNAMNNVPYIFENKQKQIEEMFLNPSNLLTLLYPGVDFGYAYVNTVSSSNETEENEFNENDTVSKKNDRKSIVFEKEKDKTPRLKVCKNIHEGDIIPSIIGSKLFHCIIYSFHQNSVYKLSTVDLPMLNNGFFSYLILLFDYSFLNDVLSYLCCKKMQKGKYKICLWDSNIIVDIKGETLHISRGDFENENEKSTTNSTNVKVVKINMRPFLEKEEISLGDISKVEAMKVLPASNFDVQLVFSSNLIKEFFLETLNLKSKSSFVIVRPDKHIIAVGDRDTLSQIEEIDKVYI